MKVEQWIQINLNRINATRVNYYTYSNIATSQLLINKLIQSQVRKILNKLHLALKMQMWITCHSCCSQVVHCFETSMFFSLFCVLCLWHCGTKPCTGSKKWTSFVSFSQTKCSPCFALCLTAKLHGITSNLNNWLINHCHPAVGTDSISTELVIQQ